MFLKNAWYVAAWEHELGREPLAVTMPEARLVLFRRSDGKPTALEDACPHRKLPLSMGRIKGDEIECGYHGLTFDRAAAQRGLWQAGSRARRMSRSQSREAARAQCSDA